MSLSNQPPAPLSEYSQLCKAKNTDSFSEAFHCVEAQKDFGKAEFEWQRTEGKLNEIGLSVNSGGQRKDGLVNKSTGFTDEDKLCFFEGKLDKDLKTAPKDTRKIESQGKNSQADPGHLESWSLVSETFPSTEGSLETLKIADFHSGQAESTRLPARLGPSEAITDQEKVAGKKAGMVDVAKCQQELPSLPLPGSDSSQCAREPESSSMWSPSFSPLLPSVLGCPESPRRKVGVPGYSVIGVINDSYAQGGFASSPARPRLGPPTTTVELAQDEFRSGCLNHIHENEEEPFLVHVDEKLGSATDSSPLPTGAHQRKAMRRTMSECSHLSVPQALNLADKYPDPVAREDLATSLVSPSSSLSPTMSPMTRKPSAPMKRSATVSEEQTSAHSPGAVQNNAELPSLLVKEQHQSLPMEEPSAKKRDERDGGSSAVQRELASPGQFHSKLEQIPELGGPSSVVRGEMVAAAGERERSHVGGEAGRLGSPGSSRASEMEASRAAAVSERQGIEVSSSMMSAPSSKEGGAPRDAKPPEIKPTAAEVATTVNDIAAPPSKELPPSPEKKAKPSATPAVKSAAAKTKPVPATAAPTKRPASATPGPNKKATSPTTGPTAAAATPKRLATSTTRPSSLTPPKEAKPKGTEGKGLEKRASPSKPPSSAAAPRPGVKSSPATSRPSTALTSTNASSPRSTASSPPKRPSTIKTDAKSTDAKRTVSKSPSADLSCPKSPPTSSTAKSSATTLTTASPALPGTAASRPKPKPAAPRLSGAASTAADSKKASTLKVTPKTSPVPKPPRPPTSVSAPDLKNIRSKIGSTDNIKHQPGGGKAKVERKAESAGAARKPELSAVSKMTTTKTALTKEGAPKQPNGKVQIVSKKANYSHVQSKCGSKDNIKHVPGGGNVHILNKKIDLSKVASKCGSKTNIKHKPGGGDVKIENQKLTFKEKAQAKVGSLDNVGHVPTGGTAKTEGGEEAAPQSGAVTAPPPGSSAMQENGVGPAAPTQGGGDQRGIQCFDTHIQETN